MSSPQPSREPQRYAPSSPPAASGFRALRAAHHCRPLLRLPRGGTAYGTLSAQQSADRSTRPAARLPPPRAGLPAALTPPWGSATSRRCALGSLLWPHPPHGHKGAAGCARCTDYLNVSGQAEGSIVTPENLSRARLATLGGYATLDRTCGVSQETSRPGRKHAGGRQRQDRASELPCGGSLLLWQPHLSTAEAACRARRQSARASGLREVLAGGFCRRGNSVGQKRNSSSLKSIKQ